MSESTFAPEMSASKTSAFDAGHLPSLDGLRFLALLLVILDHGGLAVNAGDGVTFFFVLSGFLFAWLLEREFQKTGTVSLRHFYVRRVLRIFPACLTSLAVTVVGKWILNNSIDWRHAGAAVGFWANYYNGTHDHPATGFSHYWSLSVEEQFYLLWPLLFLVCRYRSRGTVMAFLLATIAAVCAWRSHQFLIQGVSTAYVYNAFEMRFDSLAIGCLLGLAIRTPRVRQLVSGSCRWGFEPLVLIAGLLAIHDLAPKFHYSVGFTLESVIMGVLLLQMIQLGDHRLWRWLSHRWLIRLGTLSYSGYLYHTWGLTVGWHIKGLPLLAQVLCGVAATMVLAALSYRFIEQPFLRLREPKRKVVISGT